MRSTWPSSGGVAAAGQAVAGICGGTTVPPAAAGVTVPAAAPPTPGPPA
jgi:hypothetical protein